MKQREIKFRAWNKKKRKFNDSLRMLLDGNRIEEDDYGSPPDIEEDIILLQYTGLKDNTKWEELTKKEQQDWLNSDWSNSGKTKIEWNGKEIYEEDIAFNRNNKYEIIWEEGGFWAKNLSLDENECYEEFSNGPFIKELKVIGNIYENPDLLKK